MTDQRIDSYAPRTCAGRILILVILNKKEETVLCKLSKITINLFF